MAGERRVEVIDLEEDLVALDDDAAEVMLAVWIVVRREGIERSDGFEDSGFESGTEGQDSDREQDRATGKCRPEPVVGLSNSDHALIGASIGIFMVHDLFLSSETRDESVLGFARALDVELGGFDGGVSGEDLDVTQGGSGPVSASRRSCDEGPPSRVG